MRRFLLLFLLIRLPGHAQAPVRLTPPVREVALYQGAAELRHEARPALPVGLITVRLTGLALNFDLATLRATVGAGAELVSTEAVAADQPTLLDSATITRKVHARARATVVAIQEEKNLLIANREVRGTTSATWNADIGRVAAAFRERMTQVQLQLEAAQVEENRLGVVAARFPSSSGPSAAAGRDVLLRLRVRTAGPLLVGISYRVSGSSWAPVLTLRADRLTEPLRAESEGQINNATGLSWNGVRLTLVNASATQRVNRPNLQPWAARLVSPNKNEDDEDDDNDDDAAGSAGEGRLDNFAVKGTSTASSGATAPADSLSATAEGAAFSDRFRVPGRPTVPVGANTRVPIETLLLPLRTEYYVVPKLDADVLLVGKVAGLQKLRAPAAWAGVYLGGNYLGTTQMNTRAFNDSVELALGVDPRVVVSRTKRADKTSRRLLGGKQKVALGYEINLRNGRATPVRVRVADQVPVSGNKEITVTLTEKSDATLDEESGRLTWLVDLKPGESRRLAFAFTVEAPEGKHLNLDRRARRTYSPKFR